MPSYNEVFGSEWGFGIGKVYSETYQGKFDNNILGETKSEKLACVKSLLVRSPPMALNAEQAKNWPGPCLMKMLLQASINKEDQCMYC